MAWWRQFSNTFINKSIDIIYLYVRHSYKTFQGNMNKHRCHHRLTTMYVKNLIDNVP